MESSVYQVSRRWIQWPRDPNGIHAAIWEQIQDDSFQLPADQPLTFVDYECDGDSTRAYIEPVAVGMSHSETPLFLEPNGCVMVSLESTYQTAFGVLPKRWQMVLAPEGRD